MAKRPLDAVLYGLGQRRRRDARPRGSTKCCAGFPTWASRRPSKTWLCHSEAELLAAIGELDKIRHGFQYETDGAVIKLDDFALREQIGFTSKAPRWAIAYKYAPEQAQTRLNGITIQVGPHGRVDAGGRIGAGLPGRQHHQPRHLAQ